MPVTVYGRFHKKRATASAGTAITQLIDPSGKGKRTIVTGLVYLSGSTGHTITILKPLAKTTLTAAALISATTIVVASAGFRGDTIASGDYVVVQHADGTYGAYLASALSTLSVTIPALSVAAAINAPVWIMGAIGEAEHIQFNPTVSVLTRWQDSLSGICSSGYRSVASGTVYQRSGNDDPLLVHSGNATGAGVIESVSGYYG